MIESIASIAAVTTMTPSAGRGAERRQKRLKWLGSLRAALGEAGPLVEEMGAEGAETGQTRARIDDALSVVAELRGRLGGADQDAADAASGRTVTAAALARRIAASADRSIAAQAHIGAAAVRHYINGD
jgi:hypothetical protein